MEPQSTVRTISGLEMARAVWHRRKWLVLLVVATLLSAFLTVARSLPNIYDSSATLLVERPQAPDRAGGQLKDVDLETRRRTRSQQIHSPSPLDELITQ